MSDLTVCEACKVAFPAFYHPGYIVETETGRLHRGCVPENFSVCCLCNLKALPKEIMIEAIPWTDPKQKSEWVCPDCAHGQEHGPKEVD